MASRHCIWAPRESWLRGALRAALGVVVCALVGCATTSPGPPVAQPDPQPSADAEPRAMVPAQPRAAPHAEARTEPAPRPAAADAPAEPATPAAPTSPRVEPLAESAAPSGDALRGDAPRPTSPDDEGPEIGLASWYGGFFHGRRTALGERFDMHRMTAAHKTMPLPSYALVRNRATGKEVVVRINDRGPFIVGRIIDLSRAAAREIGIAGIGRVEVHRLAKDDERVRAWHERSKATAPKPRRVAAR